ncbi:MAG: hypothetical protein HYV07_12860 [Deltaproteobacteria bacterium]|nr:hypothetical protein [Deltaproteobacteria bacterium]
MRPLSDAAQHGLDVFNLVEGTLWCAIGLAFLWRAGRAKGVQALARAAGATYIVFGFSDFVESRTGAWFRPWWLLVWKALSILTLLALYLRYRRTRNVSQTPAPG